MWSTSLRVFILRFFVCVHIACASFLYQYIMIRHNFFSWVCSRCLRVFLICTSYILLYVVTSSLQRCKIRLCSFKTCVTPGISYRPHPEGEPCMYMYECVRVAMCKPTCSDATDVVCIQYRAELGAGSEAGHPCSRPVPSANVRRVLRRVRQSKRGSTR